MILFQYLASAIIQAKDQVLRNNTTHVSNIFNLHMMFSVSSRSSVLLLQTDIVGRLGLHQFVSEKHPVMFPT